MKTIVLDNNNYEIIENIDECLDIELLKILYTDYFYDFDYILGDYAYNKLRLKGFCDKTNKRFNKVNDYCTKNRYLNEQCAYKCRYFLIKKIK